MVCHGHWSLVWVTKLSDYMFRISCRPLGLIIDQNTITEALKMGDLIILKWYNCLAKSVQLQNELEVLNFKVGTNRQILSLL